jgi:type I restriction enzyme, S subunit
VSLPRYPKYKPSGVDWLGQVPEHWGVKRLKYNLRLRTEKTCRRDHPVALENIESWTGRLISTESDFQGDGIAFDAGDILFGKLRPYLAKAYCAEFSGEAVGDFHVMRPVAGISSRFAQYQLLSREFIAIVDGSTYGSKMPRASWESVGGMVVTTPPFDEQRGIASFLDQETAKIDALVAHQQQLIELLKEKRQTVIAHAVTKGLNSQALRKAAYIDWLDEIPAHWKVLSLKRLAKAGPKTFTDGDWIESPFITSEGVRLIQTGNVGIGSYKEQGFRFISEETFHELGCTEVNPGDVLICRLDGPVGRACLAPDLGGRMITSVDNAILKVSAESVPEYVVFLLSSVPWISWIDALCRVGGGFRLRVSRNQLGELRVPVPPFEEQLAISRHLESEVLKWEGLSAEAQRAIDLLQEHRAALISAAVTGQVDVRSLAGKQSA